MLKQLDYLVGDTAFRDGLRAYLAAHAFGNATWRDLLGAIGRAAGRDLTAWGDQYILRPGIPVLEATPVSTDEAGERIAAVRVAQRPGQPALSGRAPWPIRAELLAWGDAPAPARRPLALTGASATVRLPEPVSSPALLEVGTTHAHKSAANNPTVLHDVFFRIGGAAAGPSPPWSTSASRPARCVRRRSAARGRCRAGAAC